ncbi:MAG: 30S ribosomal protein S17 [Desulfatiglandaceae bacterium]
MAERGSRRKLFGTVISDKMEKTVVVLVERLSKHRVYRKFVRRRAKYMVHDPNGACRVGDKVQIIESRPVSRRKRWQVISRIEREAIE